MTATTANNKTPLNFSAQTSVLQQAPTSVQSKETNKAWLHFVAGGLVLFALIDIKLSLIFTIFEFSIGGMVGAIVTSPLDVVKTRLQVSTYNFFFFGYQIF